MKSLLKRNIKKIVMHTGYTIKPFTKMNYAYNNGIRFGETGNAVYKKCCVFFSELYQYMKNEERDERKRYDYFLSIYTM
jgi:hypothetical protein